MNAPEEGSVIPENLPPQVQNVVPPTTANISLPSVAVNINFFSGDEDENVIDWFETFEFAAKALGWNEHDMFNAVPAYLHGIMLFLVQFLLHLNLQKIMLR